jgi:hypothetical protein
MPRRGPKVGRHADDSMGHGVLDCGCLGQELGFGFIKELLHAS